MAALRLPDAVWKTCPWQPRELIATGLRQWLRCCGAALRDHQVIGMPSHAVAEPDEHCVLWQLDATVGVEDACGVPADCVAAITAAAGRSRPVR